MTSEIPLRMQLLKVKGLKSLVHRQKSCLSRDHDNDAVIAGPSGLQTVVQKVQANIKEAQSRQKRNYDKKFAVPNVSCGL